MLGLVVCFYIFVIVCVVCGNVYESRREKESAKWINAELKRRQEQANKLPNKHKHLRVIK